MTTIDRPQESSAGPTLRGLASAVLFLAFFSTLWVVVGIGGLNGLDETGLALLTVLIELALFVAGGSLSRTARRLPQLAAGAVAGQQRCKNRWFLIIFGAELLLILIAHVVLSLINRLDLFIPATMFIVGVHFFPLAALFRVKIYYPAGALLCVLVIATLLAVPQRLKIDGFQIAAWHAVLGLLGAIILWASGLIQWLKGKRLLALRKSTEVNA
jgi:hypothetical protein